MVCNSASAQLCLPFASPGCTNLCVEWLSVQHIDCFLTLFFSFFFVVVLVFVACTVNGLQPPPLSQVRGRSSASVGVRTPWRFVALFCVDVLCEDVKMIADLCVC